MSRTKKEGKRRRGPPGGGESTPINDAKRARHTFGSTEKILRRNRKTWVRLANKRRRVEGKRAAGAG